ncbi:MAG: hypothetical protein AUH91_02845 [Verrucomicrobia bacterium 13_1_40CM_4_54_4]|nr:MAG: hypothetical protein AUH91_02845 [Verrucomicrobia bacterium 13_1_40CM_4_54_4]
MLIEGWSGVWRDSSSFFTRRFFPIVHTPIRASRRGESTILSMRSLLEEEGRAGLAAAGAAQSKASLAI